MLIKDNLPRGKWKIGKILELIKGRDQAIRSAKVLISPNKVFHRALNLLYPIECPEEQNTRSQDHIEATNQEGLSSTDNKAESREDCDNSKYESQTDKEDKDSSPTRKRPVRQATLAAKQKLKRWINPSENFAALGSVAILIAMLLYDVEDSN